MQIMILQLKLFEQQDTWKVLWGKWTSQQGLVGSYQFSSSAARNESINCIHVLLCIKVCYCNNVMYLRQLECKISPYWPEKPEKQSQSAWQGWAGWCNTYHIIVYADHKHTSTDKRNIWKIVYLCNFIHCFHEPVRNKMILAFACKVPNRNLISHALACKIEPKELLNACLQRRKESFEEKLSCSVWLLVIFVSFLFSFWTTLTTLLHQSLPCLMGCY